MGNGFSPAQLVEEPVGFYQFGEVFVVISLEIGNLIHELYFFDFAPSQLAHEEDQFHCFNHSILIGFLLRLVFALVPIFVQFLHLFFQPPYNLWGSVSALFF